MIELKWRSEWDLGVANLDYHHTKTFNEINRLLLLIESHTQQVKHDNRAEIIATNHEKILHALIDNKLMPCILGLKNEITEYLEGISQEEPFIKKIDFYRRDYLTLMAELHRFMKDLRYDNGISINYSTVHQIKIWFSLHMKCLQKIVISFS